MEKAKNQAGVDPTEIAKLEQVLRYAAVQRLVKGRASGTPN
jgi:hypothetical protein